MTKLWKDMSRAEKGEILLAYHEGKTIQFKRSTCETDTWMIIQAPTFSDIYAYRIKPAPKIRKVDLYFGELELTVGATREKYPSDPHKLTLTIVDGVVPVGRFMNERGDVIEIEQF